MREAYSHEVSSAGFWPGSADAPFPLFYSYAYPTPDGFAHAAIEPAGAMWNTDLGEFILPYDEVRSADLPEYELMRFLQTTYEAAADTGGWMRDQLERSFKTESNEQHER